MGSTRRHKAARKSPEDWKFHRKTIERLFLEERIKLDAVVERMSKQYQFHAKYDVVHIQFCHHLLTATSKPQYERQLKEWGIRINLKASEWQDLFQILSSLPNSGQYHEVRLTGQIIDADRLAREKLRRGVKDGVNISRSCPELPKGVTIQSPLDVRLSPGVSDTTPPTPEWTALVTKTYSVPLLPSSPMNMPALSNMEWQHQHFSLGIFEPHAWTRAIDWSLLASLSQRNAGIAKLLDPNSISLSSVVHSFFQSNGQLIVRDPDFLIPFCILSSLLNGTEPSGNITNSQLHGVLRALPISIVLKLFENLESPYSDILRQRVFASALDAGDAKIVDAMLSLGLDPCEKIWFDSDISNSADFPLERALHHRQFSVCKAIVTHRCKPRSPSDYNPVQDQVLRELIDAHYRLTDRYDPMTSSEWEEFADLIEIPLSKGASPTNECFFVAFYDQSLAPALIELDSKGVNGWIERGLLASRWLETRHSSSATKAAELQQVHWILTYILRQQKEYIATGNPMIVAELVRTLKTAVEQRDPRAIFIIVDACSDMFVELGWHSPDDPLVDILKPCLEQNWAVAQALIEEHDSHGRPLGPDRDQAIGENRFKKLQESSYAELTKDLIADGNTGFFPAAEQYVNDADLRYYFHTRDDRADQQLFKMAVERNQYELIVTIYRGLALEYPRRLENSWPLAHILRMGNTAAMSAVLRDSEAMATALISTEASPPNYSLLEDLLYRVQGSPLPPLSKSSNAHQQVLLRCISYHAIHTSNYSLLHWLVNNAFDMDEFGIFLGREVYRVFFENMQKIAAHSGLMSNKGCDFPVQIFPSLLSIAAMQNNVPMVRSLVELGADGRDSMALARAVQAGADTATIDALLQAADLDNRARKVRHYGSAALREAIRRKDHDLLRFLAKHVDVNGIELLPNEIFDPRSVEPLSPLGEAILVQDDIAIRTLLEESCDTQALVCYSGSPEEHNRGTYLHRLSPLLAAIDLQNLPIVQMLVNHGASVAPGPTQGLLRSPLQRAAEIGCFEIVKYLLSRGAPVDDPPFYSGGTPLQLAALSGHDEIAELLIENHADPNYPPAAGDGRSAFEAAAEWGRANMMTLLIKRGVHLDRKFEDDSRSQYDRALHFAEHNGHPASKRFVQRLYEDVGTARFKLTLTNSWDSTHRENLLEEFPMETESLSWIPDGRPLFFNP
jgi:ankyrin repeat protein